MAKLELKSGRVIELNPYELRLLYFGYGVMLKQCLSVEDMIEVYQFICSIQHNNMVCNDVDK